MNPLAAMILVVALVSATEVAEAAEVRVISAGAVRAVVTDLAKAYEKETGNTVVLTFGPVGVVRQKLASEPADVVIMSDTALDDAIAKGSVAAGSRTDIARTGMGVGVREGAPKLDISVSVSVTRTTSSSDMPHQSVAMPTMPS